MQSKIKILLAVLITAGLTIGGVTLALPTTIIQTQNLKLNKALIDVASSSGSAAQCLTSTGTSTLWATCSAGGGGGGGGVGTSTANYFTYYGSATAVTGTPLMQLTAGTITFTSTTVFSNLTATSASTTNLYVSNQFSVNSSSPIAIQALQGSAGRDIFAINSATGTSLLRVTERGNFGFNSTTANAFVTIVDPLSGVGGDTTSTSGMTVKILGAIGKFPLMIYSPGVDTQTPSLIRFENASGNKGRIAVTGVNTLGINAALGQKLNFGANGPSTIDLVVLQNHFVGIGTTTPLSWFAVQPQPGIHNIADFASSSGATALRILDNGYVGVNTGTPRANLAVEGSALINGPATSTNLSITAITSCNASNQALQTDSIGGVTCGTLATGGGGSGAVNTSTANYFSYYLTGTSVTGTPLMQNTAGTITFTSTTNFAGISATSITSTNIFYSLLQGTNALVTNVTSTNLNISGLTNLANTTITNATTTNLYASSLANLVGLTFTTANGTSITSTNANFTNLTFGTAVGTSVTTTNLNVSGQTTVGNFTQSGEFSVTDAAATFSSSIIFAGGAVTIDQAAASSFSFSTDGSIYANLDNASLTAERTFSLQDKTGILAMTDDNISQFTNDALYITQSYASSSFLGVDYPSIATSTFVSKSATTSFPNLTQVGTLANLVWTNATGTNVNITGLTNLANTTITNVTSTNLSVSGLSGLQGLTFSNATGTNANISGLLSFGNASGTNVTTTNLYISGTLKDNTGSKGAYGQVAMSTGTGWLWVNTSSLGISGGGSTNPAGSNSFIQYNNNGAFGASTSFSFSWNTDSTSILRIGTSTNHSRIKGTRSLLLEAVEGSNPYIDMSGESDLGYIAIGYGASMASGTEAEGDIAINASDALSNSNGGNVEIRAGSGADNIGNGGELTLAAGDTDGTGTGGNITLSPGGGATGSGGIRIESGFSNAAAILRSDDLASLVDTNFYFPTVSGTFMVRDSITGIVSGTVFANVTSTNLSISGLTAIQGLTFTNATGTNANVSGLFSFGNANGTNVTSTNLYLSSLLTMASGGKILLSQSSTIALASLTDASTHSGITETGTLGVTSTFGDVVYLNTDAKWYPANATVTSTSGGVRVAMNVSANTTSPNVTINLLTYGKVRDTLRFPNFTTGTQIYLGTASGTLQVLQPSGSNQTIRVMGHANGVKEIFFNPATDFMTRL